MVEKKKQDQALPAAPHSRRRLRTLSSTHRSTRWKKCNYMSTNRHVIPACSCGNSVYQSVWQSPETVGVGPLLAQLAFSGQLLFTKKKHLEELGCRNKYLILQGCPSRRSDLCSYFESQREDIGIHEPDAINNIHCINSGKARWERTREGAKLMTSRGKQCCERHREMAGRRSRKKAKATVAVRKQG